MNAYLIVLDSVGIGAAPDAADYGDSGTSTLAHTAASHGGLNVPIMQSLGLGNIPPLSDGKAIQGVTSTDSPRAAFGCMEEKSTGKDTTTGHWEIAGLCLEKGLALFPSDAPSFPASLTDELVRQTGRGIIGNKAASGTAIINELGEQQMQTGQWIVYTSADSVLQIAAHEEIIPLEELYQACRIARELCNPLQVGRVIARPFLGTPGNFTRTDNRRDFSLPLPEPTILHKLSETGHGVITVGKLDDIFPDCGVTQSFHAENNPDAIKSVLQLAQNPSSENALIFINLIDFDMRYGHRRDPSGYAQCLENTDRFLAELLPMLQPDDILIITADHGNDPTHTGSDHTRERVPLLVYGANISPQSLGCRQGFYDIAQSLATYFGVAPMPRGNSFL